MLILNGYPELEPNFTFKSGERFWNIYQFFNEANSILSFLFYTYRNTGPDRSNSDATLAVFCYNSNNLQPKA